MKQSSISLSKSLRSQVQVRVETECLGEVTKARGSKLIVSSLLNDGDVQTTINEKVANDNHESALNGRKSSFERKKDGEKAGEFIRWLRSADDRK